MDTHKNKNATDDATVISDMINDYAFDCGGTAEKLTQTHPTVQQGFMRLAVAFINNMADKPDCDGRNRHSVELARRLKPVIDGHDYLPLI